MEETAQLRRDGLVFPVKPWLALALLILLAGCATPQNVDRHVVTVQQVVAMSREGIPAADIIRTIRNSGTVYRLDASQLVLLQKDGVPNAVLNYMQHTYIKAVRRNQALQDRGYWTQGADGYWYGGIPYGWPYDYEFFPPDEFGGGEDFEGNQEEFEQGQGDNGDLGEQGEDRDSGGDRH